MADERIRRPPLERTQPIRSWATLVESPGTAAATRGTAGAEDQAERPAPGDAVAAAVEVGYRVIDEYIERGQRAAQQLRRGTYGPDALGEDLQDLAGRLVRYFSDFGSTWLEVFDRTGVGGARPRANDGPPPASEATHPVAPPATPLHVRLEVVTRRRVQAALDITGTPSGDALLVHGLRAPNGAGPRLHDVTFVAGPHGGGSIRVHVPDDVPAGSYSGLVLDAATNRPVGALTVVLHEP